MIFGYFLHTVREKKVYMPLVRIMTFLKLLLKSICKISRTYEYLCLIFQTLVTTGSLLALFGSGYAMYQEYPEWNNPIIEDLNLSFEKSLWALSVCWMIFACVCGYGGKSFKHTSRFCLISTVVTNI